MDKVCNQTGFNHHIVPVPVADENDNDNADDGDDDDDDDDDEEEEDGADDDYDDGGDDEAMTYTKETMSKHQNIQTYKPLHIFVCPCNVTITAAPSACRGVTEQFHHQGHPDLFLQ